MVTPYSRPYLNISGDEEAALQFIRLGKVELAKTVDLAKKFKVPIYARKYSLADGKSYIRTSISGGIERIEIYIEPGAIKHPDIQLEIKPPPEPIEHEACPPGFLVYRRNYIESYPRNSGGIFQSGWDIPYNEDPDNPGTFDVEKRDPVGKLLVYDKTNEKWTTASLDTVIEPPSGILGLYGHAEKSSESYHGGWWGLPTVEDKLNNTYPGCNILGWAGNSIQAFSKPYFQSGVPGDEMPEPWASESSATTRPRLRPYLWFQGKKIVVQTVRTYKKSRVVLGASILDHEGVDYFYVLVYGDRDSWPLRIYEFSDEDTHEYIYRMPVNTMMDPDVDIDLEWEQVVAIPFGAYASLVGKTLSGTKFTGSATTTSFVSLDGEYATVYRYFNVFNVGVRRYIVRIKLRTGALSLIEAVEDYLPIGNLTDSGTLQTVENPVNVSAASASVNYVKNGLFLYLFTGLDKLYVYREQVSAQSSMNASLHIGDGTIDEGVYSGQGSGSIIRNMVCFELLDNGTEKEVSRIQTFSGSYGLSYAATRIYNTEINDYVETNETPSGSVNTVNRKVIFHHPKIPDTWHVLESVGSHNGNASGSQSFKTPDDAYTMNPASNLYTHGWSAAGYGWGDGSPYWAGGRVYAGTSEQSVGPEVGMGNSYENNPPTNSDYSINITEPVNYTFSGPTLRLNAYFSPLIAFQAGTIAYFGGNPSIDLPHRVSYFRYIKRVATSSLRGLDALVNAVVHRPTEEGNDWSYIYYLPKYYVNRNNNAWGIYKMELTETTYDPQPGFYGYYTKPQGWIMPDGNSNPPPQGAGTYDINFFSNVLTLEEIKELTGEDEDFLDGLGII